MIAERGAALRAKFSEFKNHKIDVKRKLLISAGLSAGVAVTNWVGIPAFVLKETEFVGKLPPEGWMLGLGYGAQTASSVWSVIQERRLLNNPRIGMNQKIEETAAYYGLEKIKQLREKGRRSKAAVLTPTLLSLIWVIPREITLFSLALSTGRMQELAALKSAQASFSFSQSGAAEVVLRTFGREKKKVKEKEAEIFASGVVFAPQPSAD